MFEVKDLEFQRTVVLRFLSLLQTVIMKVNPWRKRLYITVEKSWQRSWEYSFLQINTWEMIIILSSFSKDLELFLVQWNSSRFIFFYFILSSFIIAYHLRIHLEHFLFYFLVYFFYFWSITNGLVSTTPLLRLCSL